MAIRAVDMQIMMPRMADLSVMHQTEKERPVMEQLQMAAHQNKQVEHGAQMVVRTAKRSQMKNEADARKKGKNSYTYHPSKHHPTEVEKAETTAAEDDGHRLDIKI